MSEVKWIKIVTDIFDDEKMLLIENLPSADSIIVIWFKLLCLAGKTNNSGVFLLNDKIAYTDEMLATIFRRDVNTVRLALTTFEKYEMIEIVNSVITIPNWNKHQSLDSLEKRRERQREYMRERRAKQKLLTENNGKANCKANSKTNVSLLEEEVDRDIDRDIDREEEIEIEVDKKEIRIDVDIYINKWNQLGLNKLMSIKYNTNRYKQLKARIEDYGEENVIKAIENISKSDFLQGKNSKGWTITFDWLIKPNNFIKVLEGNYDNKQIAAVGTANGFNNFEPRKYDYKALEDKLLGWD